MAARGSTGCWAGSTTTPFILGAGDVVEALNQGIDTVIVIEGTPPRSSPPMSRRWSWPTMVLSCALPVPTTSRDAAGQDQRLDIGGEDRGRTLDHDRGVDALVQCLHHVAGAEDEQVVAEAAQQPVDPRPAIERVIARAP